MVFNANYPAIVAKGAEIIAVLDAITVAPEEVP